jgi:hypothetical protein
VASDADDHSTPALVREALAAGFTVDHLRQAEDELVTPSAETPKVCAKMKEGSITGKIVETWVTNRRSKMKPWSGPLPPPRHSPLQTLGDAMANAKIESKKNLFPGMPRGVSIMVPSCPKANMFEQCHRRC